MSAKPNDPMELLATAQGGCAKAFERLVRLHQPLIERTARRAAAGPLLRVMELADVIQEILASVFRSIAEAEFTSLEAFRNWLERVALHRVIDLQRVHLGARRWPGATEPLPRVPSQDGSDVDRDTPRSPAARAASPSEVLIRREQLARLEQVLRRLSQEHQEVIRCIVLDRLPTRDLAIRMGRTQDALRQLLRRALTSCRLAIVEDSKESGRPLRRSVP